MLFKTDVEGIVLEETKSKKMDADVLGQACINALECIYEEEAKPCTHVIEMAFDSGYDKVIITNVDLPETKDDNVLLLIIDNDKLTRDEALAYIACIIVDDTTDHSSNVDEIISYARPLFELIQVEAMESMLEKVTFNPYFDPMSIMQEIIDDNEDE